MKKVTLFLVLSLVILSGNLLAQLFLYNNPSHLKIIVNVDNTFTPPTQPIGMYYTATDMVNELVGAGVRVFNVKIDSFNFPNSGWYNPNPIYSMPQTYAKFKWAGGASDIGMDSGLVMNTGRVLDLQNWQMGWRSDSIPTMEGGLLGLQIIIPDTLMN